MIQILVLDSDFVVDSEFGSWFLIQSLVFDYDSDFVLDSYFVLDSDFVVIQIFFSDFVLFIQISSLIFDRIFDSDFQSSVFQISF